MSDDRDLVKMFAKEYHEEIAKTTDYSIRDGVFSLARNIICFSNAMVHSCPDLHETYFKSVTTSKYGLLRAVEAIKELIRVREEDLKDQIEEIIRHIKGETTPSIPSIESEINSLLKAPNVQIFEDEISGIVIEMQTDKIILSLDKETDINLNEMRIRFSTKEMNIRVKPVDPNYGHDSRYFHPHICPSGELCEGDAEEPITNAIDSGRLTDLFDLVNSILGTYNSSSPYLELESWQKDLISCYDCGENIAEDEAGCCEEEDCHTLLCLDCLHRCCHCDKYFCSSHISLENSTYCGCCYNDTKECSSCHKRSADCTDCDVCSKPLCEDCGHICSFCNSVFCEECEEYQFTCVCCDIGFCKKHLVLEDPDRTILCPDCQKRNKGDTK